MSSSDELDAGSTQVVSMAALGLERGPHAILLMVADGQVFRLPLTKDVSIIGRAVESDVKLDFADVSRKHFKIERDAAGGYKITDLGSSGGTFLTPEDLPELKVEGTRPLYEHEIIRVAGHRFRFVIPREVKEGEYPKLLPVSGGPMVQLAGAVCSIGRANASFVIPDPRVSTKHAIVETFAKNSVYVIDQRSANGTTVNGEPVTEARKLVENDTLAFAGIAYRVSLLGADARTMIGVVAAAGSPRSVGTGTLRMDSARQQITQQLPRSDSEMNLETVTIRPAKAGDKGQRASTGTYTGPSPLAPEEARPSSAKQTKLAAAQVVQRDGSEDAPPIDDPLSITDGPAAGGPPWLVKLRQRLREPSGTLAVRIASGVVLVALLLYPYVLTVTGECRLAPGSVQKVRSTLPGRIEKVLVIEGQKVKRGDLLVQLADRDVQLDKQKAEAAVAEAKRALERSGLKGAQTETLAAVVSHAESALERAQLAVEQTAVRAGIDGKVVSQAPQNLLNTVVSVGQELLEIDETQRVIAEVLVAESDIGDVFVGQSVYAKLYTDTTETHESQVQTIMPVAERGVLGSFVVVKAPLKNDDERLIPGTTGVAKLIAGRHLGIVLLVKKIAHVFK